MKNDFGCEVGGDGETEDGGPAFAHADERRHRQISSVELVDTHYRPAKQLDLSVVDLRSHAFRCSPERRRSRVNVVTARMNELGLACGGTEIYRVRTEYGGLHGGTVQYFMLRPPTVTDRTRDTVGRQAKARREKARCEVGTCE